MILFFSFSQKMFVMIDRAQHSNTDNPHVSAYIRQGTVLSDLSPSSHYMGNSVLHVAACRQHANICKQLVVKGKMDVNIRNVSSQTPLHLLLLHLYTKSVVDPRIMKRFATTIYVLVNKLGANPILEDTKNQNALIIAKQIFLQQPPTCGGDAEQCRIHASNIVRCIANQIEKIKAEKFFQSVFDYEQYEKDFNRKLQKKLQV